MLAIGVPKSGRSIMASNRPATQKICMWVKSEIKPSVPPPRHGLWRPGTRREKKLSEQLHPAAPHHLPFFIPGADGSDTLMVVMGIFLLAAVLWVGTLYWKLHSLRAWRTNRRSCNSRLSPFSA